jgi:BirA family transcriptional regulator, biotin operon repressor / biotin---[acetyl-CoA-carboxylase] ligase
MNGLAERLAGQPFVSRVVWLESVDSTNDEARRRAAAGWPAGTVIVAEGQTAGRGRLGRRWFSPPGLGLYVTVLLRPSGPPGRMPQWTLGAAVAACAACREISVQSVTIAWPNDLMVGPRKLGGVLAELRHPAQAQVELALGMGLNVLHGAGDFPAELADRATSLRLAAGPQAALDRERLAARYLIHLGAIAQQIEADRFAEVAQRWESFAPGTRGRRVRIRPGGDRAEIAGRIAGIDAVGALIVRAEDGRVTTVHAAESVLAVED